METLVLNSNIAVLALGVCALSSFAFAADQPLHKFSPTSMAEETEPRFELFSSVSTTTQHSWDNYFEGTAAVWGALEESGLRGRVSSALVGMIIQSYART